MTSRSKIVDLKPQGAEDDASIELSTADEPLVTEDALPLTDWDLTPEYYGEEPVGRRWTAYVVPGLLLTALAAWTGFFGYTFRADFSAIPANDRIVTLITSWSVPALLVAALWLLWMRSSRAEATRFADTAASLRLESDALENRMRTVNEEIALAREFLAQNARELETLGRHSAKQLTDAADQLSVALADSDAKAKTLEQVSDAATSNLEQLRKHLPVVTSAAKDVTNQIGNAGNAAQVQAKSLISALTRVADAGRNVRDSMDGIEDVATNLSENLDQGVARNAALLRESADDAEARVSALAQALTDHSSNMRTQVEQATQQVETAIAGSGGTLGSHVEALRDNIAALAEQSDTESNKINETIARISTHIEATARQIADIDEQSTDRTAKLAFALSALDESTKSVGSTLGENHSRADQLVERAETLLATLKQASDQIDGTLPEAASRLETTFTQSLSQLEAAAANSGALEAQSDALLLKIRSVEDLIEAQRAKVEQLMADSDTHFVARHEQAEALAEALTRTRGLIEEMSGEAGERIVGSLMRVQEAAQSAADSSRKIVEEELSGVAEKLTQQNSALLSQAVDSQIATLGEMINSSVERNLALSEDATRIMAGQLSSIDEMTANLEKRIQEAKSGFDGLDDDGFARRMALLTESLNSTAIDVAKILSNEVTDTAWASYLKGDRGVFTRRAVRLLDAGEARAIANHYDEDPEFAEHVNRYIHDFESMMRVLLSTRDGNAIGVTLLSSDVGKLYVALAQAIERLRS